MHRCTAVKSAMQVSGQRYGWSLRSCLCRKRRTKCLAHVAMWLFCVSPVTSRVLFCPVFLSSCLLHGLLYPSFISYDWGAQTCCSVSSRVLSSFVWHCDTRSRDVKTAIEAIWNTFGTVICTAILLNIWTIFACFCSLYVVKMKDLNYWQSTFSHFRGVVGNKALSSIL